MNMYSQTAFLVTLFSTGHQLTNIRLGNDSLLTSDRSSKANFRFTLSMNDVCLHGATPTVQRTLPLRSRGLKIANPDCNCG
jgi:hypothetical protein